jgi:hypothetical protein
MRNLFFLLLTFDISRARESFHAGFSFSPLRREQDEAALWLGSKKSPPTLKADPSTSQQQRKRGGEQTANSSFLLRAKVIVNRRRIARIFQYN